MDISNSNTLDSSSDEETFINVEDIFRSQLNNIYQIQLNIDSLIIKHIGNGSHVPDIIIKESFGKNNNLSLYNCVYMESEVDFLKLENYNDKFIPIIKLIEKNNSDNNIFTISVKINNFTNYNEKITDFNIYITHISSSDYIHHIALDKHIDHSNIIEKMLENIIDFGFDIL